ncbi:MAG: AraC family transcriptional regulator [Methyloligellaceae bacterium]
MIQADSPEVLADFEFFPVNTPRRIVARSLDWPEKFERAPHFHDRCQLVYSSKGVMNVQTLAGSWVVPPQRAIWMPANVVHTILAKTSLSFRTIYFDPSAAPRRPIECCILNVSPLLRSLILEAMEIPQLYEFRSRDERIMNFIVHEIEHIATDTMNLHLPEPKDPRLRRIVEAIKANPADNRSPDDWSKISGASSRTIQRIFRAETGMTFGQWKRQAIILESIRMLSDGKSVINVALDLGYDSPSAFSAMFRRTLGVAPSKYLK